MKCHLPILCLVLLFVQMINGQEWESIIPLKSTKTDVEKILGLPQGKDKYSINGFKYISSAREFTVFYASERCQGYLTGWNVPADTVLTFSIAYKESRKFHETEIDKNGLIDFRTDDATAYYIDSRRGIKYSVSPSGEINYFTYLPLESDNKKRCKGFPHYTVAGYSYIPIARIETNSDIEYGKGTLDTYLATITQNEDILKMYVVIYSKQNTKETEH